MQNRQVNRRRVLSIVAGTGAAAAFGLAATGPATSKAIYKWRGTALGADASMTFFGINLQGARQGLQLALDEIARLEDVFSLYKAGSEIRRLNETGLSQPASIDMRQLLTLSAKISRATNGLFDPTVQATLEAVAGWVEKNPFASRVPVSVTQQTRRLIDFTSVDVTSWRIKLANGQKITLNGIAQGYIADQIANLLRNSGFDNILVNTGEFHAIGAKPDGSAFTARLAGTTQPIALDNTSLAVSSSGQVRLLDGIRPFTHLIDPATGRNRRFWKQIAVRHPSAAVADGLSTALCNCDFETAKTILNNFPGSCGWFVSESDIVRQFQSGQS